MALYYYDKYELRSLYKRVLVDSNLYTSGVDQKDGWSFYTLLSDSGNFYARGDAVTYYFDDHKDGFNSPTFYTVSQFLDGRGPDYVENESLYEWQYATISEGYGLLRKWYQSEFDRYTSGSFIETITAEDGTYPDDGEQGGYWYTKGELFGTVTLTTPNGGETWSDVHTITFTLSETDLRTHIQLSTDDGETWSDIIDSTVADATSYDHDFSNETATSTARVRVRAYDGSTYGVWDQSDGVFTIQHNQAPTEPTELKPAGTSVDRTVVQRFSWNFNDPNVNDSQSKFDLRWRLQGTTTWNNITQETSNNYYDMSANVLPAGEIEWQVRTYDQFDLSSPYSQTAIFTSAEPTDAPTITSPVDTVSIANPTVKWTSTGQESYQLVIEDSLNVVVWDTGEVVSGNKARTVGIDLDNGGQYTIKLRVKDSSGLWSSYDSVSVTVSYTPPAKPVISTSTGDASITIVINNPTPEGTQPPADFNHIYRREGGEWVRIAEGIPPNVNYIDYTPATSETYEYKVRARSGSETYADSDITSGYVEFIGVWLHDVTDPDTLHKFRADGSGRESNWSVESSNIRFAGRKYPVTYFSEQENESVTVGLQMFPEWGDYEALNQIIKAKNIICYRDGRGRRMFGTIRELPFNDEKYGYQTTITIIRTSYSEVV